MNPNAASATRLHGIPNCDTVRKARAWLIGRSVPAEFVDFKKHGLPPETLARWMAALGWESLLNRKGSTWRGLDSAARECVTDAASAARLMQRQPSVDRRPVVEWPDGEVTVGFDALAWAARLQTGGATRT